LFALCVGLIGVPQLIGKRFERPSVVTGRNEQLAIRGYHLVPAATAGCTEYLAVRPMATCVQRQAYNIGEQLGNRAFSPCTLRKGRIPALNPLPPNWATARRWNINSPKTGCGSGLVLTNEN